MTRMSYSTFCFMSFEYWQRPLPYTVHRYDDMAAPKWRYKSITDHLQQLCLLYYVYRDMLICCRAITFSSSASTCKLSATTSHTSACGTDVFESRVPKGNHNNFIMASVPVWVSLAVTTLSPCMGHPDNDHPQSLYVSP